MGFNHLVFKSSKLGYKSNKLAMKKDWYSCDQSNAKTRYGYASTTGTSGYLSSWPYPTQELTNAINMATGASAIFSTSHCWANLVAYHGHGCTGYPQNQDHSYHLPMKNYGEYAIGYLTFMRPTGGPSSITEAVLRLSQCGRVLHTQRHGVNATYYDRHAMTFDYISTPPPTIGDGSIFLKTTFYADATHTFDLSLSLADIRSMNATAGNGIMLIDNFWPFYSMNGYIDITLPAGAISLLNDWAGIHLRMMWKWVSGVIGPYCSKCCGDYSPKTTAGQMAASSINSSSVCFAGHPELWIA